MAVVSPGEATNEGMTEEMVGASSGKAIHAGTAEETATASSGTAALASGLKVTGIKPRGRVKTVAYAGTAAAWDPLGGATVVGS